VTDKDTDKKPAEKKPADKATDLDKKPLDKKPVETKDLDKKPVETKDLDKKPLDKKIEKDKKPDTDKKVPPPIPLVSGMVQAVDDQKGTFTISVGEGKSKTFMVNEGTKFVGAKGGSRGMGKAGLKDEGMTKGSTVRVMALPGEMALEVHLPARKTPATKDADKTKEKVKQK